MTQTTTIGPITLADVKSALGDTDPAATNAGALRGILGRGSYATIQKHLDHIRAELVPVAEVAPGTAPGAPTMLIDQVWVAAWTAAQVQTFARLETVVAERDAARALAAAQAQDVEALALEVDALTETAASISTAAEQAAAAAAAQVEKVTAEQAATHEALQGARSALELAKSAATTATELAKRDALIERQALQATIDRLTDQTSDLKSLLARLSPAVQQ